jgi:hypothetical protein
MIQDLTTNQFSEEAVSRAMENQILPKEYNQQTITIPDTLERRLNSMGWRWNPDIKPSHPCTGTEIIMKYRYLRNLNFYDKSCVNIMDLIEQKKDDKAIQHYHKLFVDLYNAVKDGLFSQEDIHLLFYSQPIVCLEPLVNPPTDPDTNWFFNFIDSWYSDFSHEFILCTLRLFIQLWVFSSGTVAFTPTVFFFYCLTNYGNMLINYAGKLLMTYLPKIPGISHFVNGVTNLFEQLLPTPRPTDSGLYKFIYFILSCIIQMLKLGTRLTFQIIPTITLQYVLGKFDASLLTNSGMKAFVDQNFSSVSDMTSYVMSSLTNNFIIYKDQIRQFFFSTLRINPESAQGRTYARRLNRLFTLTFTIRTIYETYSLTKGTLPAATGQTPAPVDPSGQQTGQQTTPNGAPGAP